MSHTPAPWKATKEWNGESWKIKGNYSIATIIATSKASLEEKEANARLIASAPELLAMLELATRYLEHPDVLAVTREMVLSRARAAIAKAQG